MGTHTYSPRLLFPSSFTPSLNVPSTPHFGRVLGILICGDQWKSAVCPFENRRRQITNLWPRRPPVRKKRLKKWRSSRSDQSHYRAAAQTIPPPLSCPGFTIRSALQIVRNMNGKVPILAKAKLRVAFHGECLRLKLLHYSKTSTINWAFQEITNSLSS